MQNYNIIAEQEHTTVMAHYEALPREDRGYQSEAELEAAFIKQLVEQGYERVNITDEKALILNLRRQMDRLNGLTLSDKEWKQLFEGHIASPQMTIEDKTERIQRTEIVNITRDNGASQNIKLIDKRNVHNNHVQVLNQYTPEGGTYANRYDVTILVNGLPLVHCELKRRGVPLKEAFNQINRYERDGGFNSIFCVDSIPSAIKYYKEFKKQQEEKPEARRLRIATIFTYSANEAEDEHGFPPDEDPGDTSGMDATSREFLESAIGDYNRMFDTKYSTDSEKFQNYYKDLSLRMKNREVDMLIVVSMFLTGFDAKTLNTLWVDKNLKMHGLLQAYSRTNRILNSIKDCGNIVCFRNLEKATNESFALFGDKDAAGVVLMRPFADYYYGYTDEKGKHVHGYKEIVEALLAKYVLPINPMTFTLDEKKEFVKLFGGVLKMQNLLSAFDEFTGEMRIVSDFDVQDYLTWYNDLHEELRPGKGGEKDSIEDDLIFEMELVKQIQINIPYILQLVKQYHEKNCEDKTLIAKIQKAIGSSPDLRDKKELIMKFIERMTISPDVPDTPEEETDIDDEWTRYIQEQREADLQAIIREEKLKPEETRKFMEQSFVDGYVTTTGVAITKVLPPMPIFGGGASNREVKKRTVLEKLTGFFNKYFGLLGSMSNQPIEKEKKHVLYDLDASTNSYGIAAEEEVMYQRKRKE